MTAAVNTAGWTCSRILDRKTATGFATIITRYSAAHKICLSIFPRLLLPQRRRFGDESVVHLGQPVPSEHPRKLLSAARRRCLGVVYLSDRSLHETTAHFIYRLLAPEILL